MSREFKSCLKCLMSDYIKYKHSCGLKYTSSTATLYYFDTYCFDNAYSKETLDREITMTFLNKKDKEKMTNICHKATVLRQFGYYLRDICKLQNTFIVPCIPLRGQDSFIPYVFSSDEITRIIHHAQNYESHTPAVLPNIINAISAIITLLYCTGMRAGEVAQLKVDEVDLANQLIYINTAKNDNKRMVTISDSMTKELQRYVEKSKICSLSNVYFFDAGLPRNDGMIATYTMYHYFRKILKISNIKHLGKGKGPRLHDLRTTFCCHSLKKLTTMDIDINAYIVYLSTYLGHKSLRETQDYVWLTAELFEETRVKLDTYTICISNIYQDGFSDD